MISSAYGYVKSFHVRTLSFGVFLAMAFYYGVIAFHWQHVAAWTSKLSFPVLGYALMMLFMVAMKGGMAIRVYSLQRSGRKARNAVILVSFYLAVAIAAFGLLLFLSGKLRLLFTTNYWTESHWFWISTLVLLSFVLVGYILERKKLVAWAMLQDLKAIPIVSPVFCFGAPVVWSTNLAYASLPKDQLTIYNSLSILSGVLFLLYWVVYAVVNHVFADGKADDSPKDVGILGPGGMPIQDAVHSERVTWIPLGIFGAALYLFSIVLIDVILRLGFT